MEMAPARVETFIVLGGGAFGRRAVERLSAGHRGANITVVDRSAPVCRRLSRTDVRTICADAVEFLVRISRDGAVLGDHWIVPCVPFHVAWQWALSSSFGTTDALLPAFAPPRLPSLLPNPMPGGKGEWFASHADFLCPDDCPEPARRCTVTGRPREADLSDRIAGLPFAGWEPLVLRSVQLAPGIGGYRYDSLCGIRDRLRGGSGRFLLATACRCHAVVQALRRLSLRD